MSKPLNDQSAPVTHNADGRDRIEAIVRQAEMETWVEEIAAAELKGGTDARRDREV
jgi:hypothetical protein